MLVRPELAPISALVTSFIIAYFSIPSLVKVAKAKNLYDAPGFRKSHINHIPTLGGLAIFAGVLIASSIWIDFTKTPEFKYIIAALTIVFFIGVKDDILVTAPDKKLVGEIAAAIIMVILGDIRFTNLHGFFGITIIPYWFSVGLTLFVIIVILNALNLIDGIDGLASGVGIVSSFTFGIWFYLNGEYNYALVAGVLAGGLIAFIRFNVYRGEYKIFMGDTGSLVVGTILSVLAVKFNQMNIAGNLPYSIHAAPAVSFGILIIPLFDTLRVFVIRILNKRSPFKADKNHVHHRLLKLGLKHIQATLIIVTANVIFIAYVLIFNHLSIISLLITSLAVATILSFIPEIILRKRNAEKDSSILKPKQIRTKVAIPSQRKVHVNSTVTTKEKQTISVTP